jgi:tartrate dehydrogenase/decarboxylase/D-malate dehydrogenase
MMLDHLGLVEAAAAVEKAVRAVLAQGVARTPDLGGTSGTAATTRAVLDAIG